MRMVSAAVAACLWVGAAPALANSGANALGAFFDDDGEINCFVPAAYQPFNLYWILTDPALPNLGGFEFAWAYAPEPALPPFILDLTLPEGAVNLGSSSNFIVRLDAGLITSRATTLVTISLMVPDPVRPETYITAGPASPPSVRGLPITRDFTEPSFMVPMTYATVDGDEVIVGEDGWVVPGVARFSCPGPVAAETATWSGVKALFR